MALSLDGTPQTISFSDNAAHNFPALVTSLPNDLIIMMTYIHGAFGVPSVSGSTLGTFNLRYNATDGVLGNHSIYYAVASSPLAGEVITFDASAYSSGTFQHGIVFAVNGANLSNLPTSAFDSGGPQFNASGSPASMTTVNTNVFLFGQTEVNSGTPAVSGNWITLAASANFQVYGYQIPTSGSPGLFTFTNAAGNYANSNIIDAIVASGAAAPILLGQACM